MTLAAKVRTHKISPDAALCVSGSYNLIGAESPAIEAMTDLSRVSAVTYQCRRLACDCKLINDCPRRPAFAGDG